MNPGSLLQLPEFYSGTLLEVLNSVVGDKTRLNLKLLSYTMYYYYYYYYYYYSTSSF